MLTSVSKGRAFGGPLALPLRLRLVWLERYADAITDGVGQPLFNVGGYSDQNVAFLSREIWNQELGWVYHVIARHETHVLASCNPERCADAGAVCCCSVQPPE